jgi:hypothetical protein
MSVCRFFFTILFVSISPALFAQQALTAPENGMKKLHLQQVPDSLQLDNLSLQPNSLIIFQGQQQLDTAHYSYDYTTSRLYFHQKATLQGPLEIRYRLLPFSLSAVHAHKTLAIYDSTALFKEAAQRKQTAFGPGEELFATPKLNKSGSISRGISVGNRRDVFINSSLNLQMEGELSDDLRIRASITDQNIPIQPDGNTQQLQDFDNVLVEIYNQHLSLTAGDIILQQAGNSWEGNRRLGSNISNTASTPYFLRYRRNVQGAMFRYKHQFSAKSGSQSQAGFALARGKFSSVSLSVEEGVQGPYQVRAAQNQALGGGSGATLGAFFIIANSEKVYLDGELLERGMDNDYVIDYNLGEITFTSRVLLTRYSRVYVDFEYADRNYSRSILTASHSHQFEKVRIYGSFFREGDNPNQALGFSLSDEEKWLISEAGDSREMAFVPAVDSAKFYDDVSLQPNRNADVPGVGNLYQVFYDRKDTLINGEVYEYYQFAGDQGDFRLEFSMVGEGNGNYILSGTAVNSKVYQWIPPLNGQPRGSYEPVRQLATPKSRQMLLLGSELSLSSKDLLTTEVALSQNDLNTLSSLDAEDDRGQAVMLRYQGLDRRIGKSDYQWSSNALYEYRQRHFTDIDPYRSVEFERDWSVQAYQPNDTLAATGDDHLLSGTINVKKDHLNTFNYQWIGRSRRLALRGQQHRLNFHKSVGLFQLKGDAFLMDSEQQHSVSDWKRFSVEAYLRTDRLQPGYRYRLDKNQLTPLSSDSVLFTAMNFEEHLFYLRSGDSLRGSLQLDYSLRKDFLPYQGALAGSDHSGTLTVRADLPLGEQHQLNVQLAYRQQQLLNDSLFTENFRAQDAETETLMGQLQWSADMAGGAIRSDMHYSLANGREPRREFLYVQVPVGEGAYTWRDDNQNGIEELSEFYEARYFDERNYMRVFIPGNDYILAYTNTFNYQLNIQPPMEWLEKSGIRSLLGRFSTLTSWNLSKRVSDERIAQRLLPMTDTEDTHLLSVRENLRSTLFFNRRQADYGADIGIRKVRRKQLLQGGFEERNQQAFLFNMRWNLNKTWGLRWQSEKGEEVQLLDLGSQDGSNGRNFHINYFTLWPEISWQPGMNVRLAGRYTYTNRQNQAGQLRETGDESSLQQVVGLDMRLNKLMKHSLNASLEYVDLRYDGDENSPVAYEMLDGLRQGGNIRWTLNWQQQLIEGLQLSVNYFGRKPESSPAIHSGSVMVRALF